MDNTNNEATNMNQGDLPSPDMRALSDMANKMGQRSDDSRPQNQAEETLKTHFNQANEGIEQERNERFSQLGNKTLRTIAEQSVMSDIDREDARNELKRREGEEYKEPESKNTISKEDFEAFRKDLGENLYGTEKNSDGKFEIWTPTKAQREYLEAKKAGHGDVKQPIGNKKTSSEYARDVYNATIDRILTNKYIETKLKEQWPDEGYSKYKVQKRASEIRSLVKSGLDERRKYIFNNPEGIRGFAISEYKKLYLGNLQDGKIKRPSNDELKKATLENIYDEVGQNEEWRIKNEVRERNYYRTIFEYAYESPIVAQTITNEIQKEVFRADVDRVTKNNPDIFDINDEKSKELLSDMVQSQKGRNRLISELPENSKEFLADFVEKDIREKIQNGVQFWITDHGSISDTEYYNYSYSYNNKNHKEYDSALCAKLIKETNETKQKILDDVMGMQEYKTAVEKARREKESNFYEGIRKHLKHGFGFHDPLRIALYTDSLHIQYNDYKIEESLEKEFRKLIRESSVCSKDERILCEKLNNSPSYFDILKKVQEEPININDEKRNQVVKNCLVDLLNNGYAYDEKEHKSYKFPSECFSTWEYQHSKEKIGLDFKDPRNYKNSHEWLD